MSKTKGVQITGVNIDKKDKCNTLREIYESILSGKADKYLKKILDILQKEEKNLPYNDIDSFKKDLFFGYFGEIEYILDKVKEKLPKLNKDLDLKGLKKNYTNFGRDNLSNFLINLKNGKLDGIIPENKKRIRERLLEVDYNEISDELEEILENIGIRIYELEYNLEDKYNRLFYDYQLNKQINLFKQNYEDIENKSDNEKIKFLNKYKDILDLGNVNQLVFNLFDLFKDYNLLVEFLIKNNLTVGILKNSENEKVIKDKIIQTTKNDPNNKENNLEYLKKNLEYLIAIDELFDFILDKRKISEEKLIELLLDSNFVERIDSVNLGNIIRNIKDDEKQKQVCNFLQEKEIYIEELGSLYELY